MVWVATTLTQMRHGDTSHDTQEARSTAREAATATYDTATLEHTTSHAAGILERGMSPRALLLPGPGEIPISNSALEDARVGACWGKEKEKGKGVTSLSLSLSLSLTRRLGIEPRMHFLYP